MNISKLNLRFALNKGEEKIIKEITESVGVFYEFEVDVAVELATTSIEIGPHKSGYNYILCEYESEIIGYTCYGEIPCTKDRYDLYWMVVSDKYRRMKIGKKLMLATEEKILEQDGKKVYIETSSREPYYYTRHFYKNCGYREEAVFRDYYDDGDNKIVYVKEL